MVETLAWMELQFHLKQIFDVLLKTPTFFPNTTVFSTCQSLILLWCNDRQQSVKFDKTFRSFVLISCALFILAYDVRFEVDRSQFCFTVTYALSVSITTVMIHMKKFLNSDWRRAVQFPGNTLAKKGNTVICTELPFLTLYYFFHVYYKLVIAWFLVQFGKKHALVSFSKTIISNSMAFRSISD